MVVEIKSIIHPESPHRHPRRVATCQTNLCLPLPAWRRFALSAHNPHIAILRQFNAIRVLFAGELVDIAMELRQPSNSDLLADDESQPQEGRACSRVSRSLKHVRSLMKRKCEKVSRVPYISKPHDSTTHRKRFVQPCPRYSHVDVEQDENLVHFKIPAPLLLLRSKARKPCLRSAWRAFATINMNQNDS